MTDNDRTPGSPQPAPLALSQVPVQLPDMPLQKGDLTEHYRRLDEITQQQARDASTPPVLVLPGLVAPDAEASLYLGDNGEDLLEDARANIDNGNYSLALEQLDEFLMNSPGHPEARYLQAYCHYRLGGPGRMKALRILRPLRDEPLDGKLRTLVQQLRAELRRVLTPDELRAFRETDARDPGAATRRLRAFIELAPEEPLPPYLLAVTQARKGNHEAALRTAQAGIKTAEGDTSLLHTLADQLQEVLVRTLAAGAVRELRNGQYQQARRELGRLDAEWRRMPVLKDLDTFLADLVRRQPYPKRPLPAPRGTADRVDRLYWLIAQEDVQEAVRLLAAKQLADAERSLVKALRLVPGFSWVNFLYAFSLYVQGREPERAAAAAEIAARDPALAQVAAPLLQAVEEMREALAINAAVKEYNAALESLSGERSTQQLDALRRKLEQVRARLPELRSTSTTRHGAERVRDLADAVDQRLAELKVSELVQRHNQVVEQASSLGLMTTERTELDAIDREAARLRRTVTDKHAQKLLQDLQDAIRRIPR